MFLWILFPSFAFVSKARLASTSASLVSAERLLMALSGGSMTKRTTWLLSGSRHRRWRRL